MNSPEPSSPSPTDHHQIKRWVLEHYDQLHEAAARQISHENPGQSLDVSGLINEAVCRLLQPEKPQPFKDAEHFLRTAVNIMQHVLIDRARHKSTIKAGGQFNKIPLVDNYARQEQFFLEVLIVREELERLAAVDNQAALVVEKRCQGYSIDEIADLMQLTRSVTKDLWNFGRAWLLKSLD